MISMARKSFGEIKARRWSLSPNDIFFGQNKGSRRTRRTASSTSRF